MRWTEEQHAEYLRRRGIPGSPPVCDTSAPPFLPPANEAGAFARGRPLEDGMNKLEGQYGAYLDILKHAGDVLWWRYAPMRLRLADGSYYKPDFGVLTRECLFDCTKRRGTGEKQPGSASRSRPHFSHSNSSQSRALKAADGNARNFCERSSPRTQL